MRFSEFVFAHSAKTRVDPMEFVAQLHDVVDTVIDAAMEAGVDVIDRLPWSAEEITRHVDAFVSRFVPAAEQCAESQWDDRA